MGVPPAEPFYEMQLKRDGVFFSFMKKLEMVVMLLTVSSVKVNVFNRQRRPSIAIAS